MLCLLSGCGALATPAPAGAAVLAKHPCDATVGITAAEPSVAAVSAGGTGAVSATLTNPGSAQLTGLALRVRLVAPAAGTGGKPGLSVALGGAPPRAVTLTASADGWQSQDVSVPKIQPDATVTVALRVSFPAGSPAGRYDAPLTVRMGGCSDPVGSSSALGFDVAQPAPAPEPSACACPSGAVSSPQPSAPPGASGGTAPSGGPAWLGVGDGPSAGSAGATAPAGAAPSQDSQESHDSGVAALPGGRVVQHAVTAVAAATPLPWVTLTALGVLLGGLLAALVVRRLRGRSGAGPVADEPFSEVGPASEG